jgi:PAS domain S-box-containing protein
MEASMETAALSPKVALVGGGTLAKALLEALERQGVLGSVLGVADPDETAPGVRLARERGLSTTRDFHSLYSLPGLEALVESAGDDAVLEELLRSRPPEVAVIDHTRAKLVAEGVLCLAEAALGGASPRGLNLFVRQVLDAIGDGLAILNRDLEVVEFNEAMRRMADGNRLRCWRGGERPCPECRVRKTFETGEPRQATFQACDGRWIELRTYPIRDGQGRVALVIEHTRDVTGREEAVRLLRESEAKHRALIETTDTGYLIVDFQGRVLDANAEYVRLTGHGSLDEILGRSVLEWTAERDLERNAEEVSKCGRQGFVRDLEINYVDRQGKITPIEVNATVIGTQEGRKIIALCRDITERVRAVDALAESEERYRLLVENSPDCIKLLDREGRYLSINRAGIKALGRPLAEILGRSYSDDFDPDDREAVRRTVAKAAAGEVASVEGRSAPGAPRQITWLVTLVPLRGPRGKVGRLLGVARDVTGFKRAEEAVRQANEELARLSRLKDEFLSMASHELKTPVTSIKLFCELAQRRPDKIAARLPEVLATINRQADHLVSLVNDLLDVSRLDLGRVRLELEPCDLRDLLDEVCALSRELYASHPLDCQRPQEPVLVRADGSRLIQVLQNLIDNATKYSPAGSPIEVSVEVGAGRVTIAVRDRGAGISAEDLPHIFERFYKSRGQQAVVPGLGLGLYISRELVLRHGGRLWAASRVGEGSTFYIDLPLLSQGPPV